MMDTGTRAVFMMQRFDKGQEQDKITKHRVYTQNKWKLVIKGRVNDYGGIKYGNPLTLQYCACNVMATDHRQSRDDMSLCLFHIDVYRVQSYPLSARDFSTSAKPSSSSAAT
jgi:hypothetical protein